MQCLKCGRDVAEGQVFCAACSDVMAHYPIKPGTPVTIPTRPKRIVRAAPQPKTEDQVAQLRLRLRRAKALVCALLLALVLSLGLLGYTIVNHDEGFSIGQNYNTPTAPANQGGR